MGIRLVEVVRGEAAQGFLGKWPSWFGFVIGTNPVEGEIWSCTWEAEGVSGVDNIRVGCNQTVGYCFGQHLRLNKYNASGPVCWVYGQISSKHNNQTVYCGKNLGEYGKVVEELKPEAKLMGSEVV